MVRIDIWTRIVWGLSLLVAGVTLVGSGAGCEIASDPPETEEALSAGETVVGATDKGVTLIDDYYGRGSGTALTYGQVTLTPDGEYILEVVSGIEEPICHVGRDCGLDFWGSHCESRCLQEDSWQEG